MSKVMITKLMIWPSRTVSLPGYNSAKLSAGVEIEFGKAVALDGKEVKEALEGAREYVKEEFKRQFEPYKKLLKKGGE